MPYVQDSCAILENDNGANCAPTFGIQKAGNIWYKPVKLPSSKPGTEPLSNLPGIAFMDFGAASYTLTLFPGFTSVIIPALFDASNAAATDIAAVIQSGQPIESDTVATWNSEPATGTSARVAVGATTGSGTGAPVTPSKTNSATARYASHIMLGCVIAATVAYNPL